MLYMYSFYEQFEKADDESIVLREINDHKELRPFGNGENWLAKTESVVLNGEVVKANGKLCDYIDDWFDADEYMEIFTLLAGKIKIDKVHAAHLLSDDLRTDIEGNNKYEKRIWDSKTPDEEIGAIVKELGIEVLDLLKAEIEQSREDVKNNGFVWK